MVKATRVIAAVAFAGALVAGVAALSFAGQRDDARAELQRLEQETRHLSEQLVDAEAKAARLAARLRRTKAHAQRRQRALSERIRSLRQRLDRRSRQLRKLQGSELALTGVSCEANLAAAAARGLRLPEGWRLHCPGGGLDWSGGVHWGVTCPYASCPEGPGPYVSISRPTYYVVAHELCHAAFGYGVGAGELAADACAAKHGASLAESPYR